MTNLIWMFGHNFPIIMNTMYDFFRELSYVQQHILTVLIFPLTRHTHTKIMKQTRQVARKAKMSTYRKEI